MEKKTKIVLIVVCSLLALALITVISILCIRSCVLNSLPESSYLTETIGDFEVLMFDDGCQIKGTTEEGNGKKYLVIPESLNGVPVESLGYRTMVNIFTFNVITPPEIESEALEKVYFESSIEVAESSFVDCPNLKKIMTFDTELSTKNGDIYLPRAVYEQKYGDTYQSGKYRANVSFMYNYEDAKNEGYYRIDDCDYGGKIEFVPSDSVREGYTFGGWYKEPECVNAWDFETDVLPEEKKDADEEMIYRETVLYAKWIAR